MLRRTHPWSSRDMRVRAACEQHQLTPPPGDCPADQQLRTHRLVPVRGIIFQAKCSRYHRRLHINPLAPLGRDDLSACYDPSLKLSWLVEVQDTGGLEVKERAIARSYRGDDRPDTLGCKKADFVFRMQTTQPRRGPHRAETVSPRHPCGWRRHCACPWPRPGCGPCAPGSSSCPCPA
jgi:hypothetical protein